MIHRANRGSVVAGLMVAATLWPAASFGQASPSSAPAVLVAPAELRDVSAQREFLGRVQAADKVEIRARVEGFLEKRLFTEGQTVKEGDVLFQIDQAPFRAELDQREADLAAARAIVKNAQYQLARAQELGGKQAVSQATLDQRVAEEGKAQADVLKAEAAVRRARINLDWTSITAPISGRIGQAKVTPGNVVGPNTGPLAVLVRTNPINVTFPVTQRELLAARKDTPVDQIKVRLFLPDKSLYPEVGKVDLLDVETNQGTDSVTVRASIPNPNGVLIDGMSVRVGLEVGQPQKLLTIPFTAVAIDQQGTFVLIVGPGDKVERRNISLGPQNGGFVVVDKGLAAGDRVIVEGQQRARPGSVVSPTLMSQAPV